jgi:hypothetical protein
VRCPGAIAELKGAIGNAGEAIDQHPSPNSIFKAEVAVSARADDQDVEAGTSQPPSGGGHVQEGARDHVPSALDRSKRARSVACGEDDGLSLNPLPPIFRGRVAEVRSCQLGRRSLSGNQGIVAERQGHSSGLAQRSGRNNPGATMV